MHYRFRALLPALCSVAWLGTTGAFAQAPANVAKTTAAAKVTENKAWTPPRTADGKPDLQGVWSNATNVPLERPAEGRGGRARGPAQPGTAADVHYDLSQYGLDRAHSKVAEDDRTSLVTTPDGRIPPRLPEAQQRAAARAAFTREHQWDGPETRPLSERCILWPSEGPPMLSPGYNSNVQIVQGPGYVVIEQEMIHDARIIPTDGRPHLAANVRQWMGDSTGHWEGDTLVVDTTNFTDKTAFQGSTDTLHVVERFTRVANDTLQYEFTVEDPHTWAQPWSAKTFWTKTDDHIYEYACQEGNHGMANNLSGARAVERQAEEAARKQSK
ncbi:MAG TPA: hypothetical protein VKT49_07710 [Bryobacteraceae bacterium]|nr:hypothetical protein [Bryobacteraceae bacterium]